MLGAEVLAETILEITGDKHQSLKWPGHGFRLTVPAGAVPEDTTISLAVKSLLAGEFELPENCRLVSAIYWMSTSQHFKKGVILHLQHCAITKSEAQCSQLKFVAGKCSQPSLPYLLKMREGGVFTPHSHEASITVKQFSFYAVVHEGDEKDLDSAYLGHAFYRPVGGDYVWQLEYLITRFIESLMQVNSLLSW